MIYPPTTLVFRPSHVHTFRDRGRYEARFLERGAIGPEDEDKLCSGAMATEKKNGRILSMKYWLNNSGILISWCMK